ncbi:MAG: hypothetical protein SP1CHLAM54_01790 [Chlamydiia bacterium]|nr:hypothetical protein [Chlamydiia bacterium]MCH9615097.1 hypothetical protein [Chlamydiia bacterium]MCH9628581.1 hypothetical protein [Chlamydiia bacterium]
MAAVDQSGSNRVLTDYKSAFSGKKLVKWQENLKIIGMVAFVALLGAGVAYAAVRGGMRLEQIGSGSAAIQAALRTGMPFALPFIGAGGFVVGAYFATRIIKVLHEKIHGHSKVEGIMNDWRAEVVGIAASKVVTITNTPRTDGDASTDRRIRAMVKMQKSTIMRAAKAVDAATDPKSKFTKYLALRKAIANAIAEANKQPAAYSFKRYLDDVCMAVVAPQSHQASTRMTRKLLTEYEIPFPSDEVPHTPEQAFEAMHLLTERIEADNLRGAAVVANKLGHLQKLFTSVMGHVDCLGTWGSLGFNSYAQGNSENGGPMLTLGGHRLPITFGAGFSPADPLGQWLYERKGMAYMNLQSHGAGEGVRVREMERLPKHLHSELRHGATEMGIWKVLEAPFATAEEYGAALKAHVGANRGVFPSTAEAAVDVMVKIMNDANLSDMNELEKKQAMQIGMMVVSSLDLAKDQLQKSRDRGSFGYLYRIACKQTYDRAAMINQGLFFLTKLGSGNRNFSADEMGMLGQIHGRTIAGDRRIMFDNRYDPGMNFLRVLLKTDQGALQRVFGERYGALTASIPTTDEEWKLSGRPV